MKLRQQLALIFASVTSLTVASALFLTLTLFKQAQIRQLDQALLANAELAAEEVQDYGWRSLHLDQGFTGVTSDIAYLLQYGALYRADGVLLTDTPTFGAQAPTLTELAYHAGDPLPRTGFDINFHGVSLRAVLVRAGSPGNTAAPVLLLAASRTEVDTDLKHLVGSMGGVLVAAVCVSLLLGFWLGLRLSAGIESLAVVARRVADGELGARVVLKTRQEEIRTLGEVLNQMVDRLASLVTSANRFVSHAAHELRSPLAALRGELELALRHPRSAEDYRATLEESLDSANQLITLAEDLLALARVGIHPSDGAYLGEVELSSVVAAAIKTAMPKNRDQRERAAIEFDPAGAQGLLLRGRDGDLSRMLRNLIDNALDHAPAGTPVRVITRREQDRVVLEVVDQGPGVPEAIRERIFEPFFRGDVERQRSGAGLGLGIAREIARAHGGSLRLISEPGETRFIVELPLAR